MLLALSFQDAAADKPEDDKKKEEEAKPLTGYDWPSLGGPTKKGTVAAELVKHWTKCFCEAYLLLGMQIIFGIAAQSCTRENTFRYFV